MNKSIFRYLSLMLAIVLCLGLLPAHVFAADTFKAEIPAEVKVEGPTVEADANDTFTVEISAVEPKDAPMPAKAQLTFKAGDKAQNFEMEYTELGVYSYTIKQVPGDKKYIEYDKTEYSLIVYVINGKEGIETQTVLKVGEKKFDSASFTNKYDDALDPAKVDPPIKKVYDGDGPADAVFTFEMKPSPADAPMPALDDGERSGADAGALYYDMKGEGEHEFGWMSYGEADVGKTYTYTLKELPGDDPNWTYDTNEYTLTVTVKMDTKRNADGHRQIIAVVDGKDIVSEKLDPYVFTNKYKEPEEEKTGHLTVLKEASEPEDGKTFKVGETITYTITVKNDGEIPYDNIKVDDELTGDHWTIDSLPVGASKTFTATYVATEADAEKGSVTNTAVATTDDPDTSPFEGDTTVPVTPVEKSGHLSVNKTATSTPKNGKEYTVGETITFQVTVVNDGDLTITDIKVNDELTGDKWTIDSLEPGAEKSFTATYKVTEADSKVGSVTNIATAKGTSPDPDHPNVPTKDGKVTVPVEKPDVETPKTGDDTNIALWIGLMVAAAIGMCAVAILARKRRKA